MPHTLEWRDYGSLPHPKSQHLLLRFDINNEDPEQIITAMIKNAITYSSLYSGQFLRKANIPSTHQVLALSCYILTPSWTPEQLRGDSRYKKYYTVSQGELDANGFVVYPTAVFEDGDPDPFNDVHCDIVVLHGKDLDLLSVGTPSGKSFSRQRAVAREKLAPRFRQLLEILGPPHLLLGAD